MGRKNQLVKPLLTWLFDNREKKPYEDMGLPDPKWFTDGGFVYQTLPEGDTSALLDCEPLDIFCERKSLTDFLNCCGRERPRFDNELARLASHAAAFVIIEAPVAQIRAGHPRSKMNGLSAWHSIQHWSIVYPSVHWWTVTSHTEGAMCCRNLIQEFARHNVLKGVCDD